MHEILFRGKNIDDGHWTYGTPITLKNCETYMNFEFMGWIDRALVIPETVGQYTGLTDKNGKKIFEGDILEGDLDDNLDPGARWRSIVVWGTFGWMCKGRQCLPMDAFDILEGEIIGNIYDNPELLGGEKNG